MGLYQADSVLFVNDQVLELLLTSLLFLVFQARPRKPPDEKSDPVKKSLPAAKMKGEGRQGGIPSSSHKEGMGSTTASSKGQTGLLQDQDVPDLDVSLEDSLVTPATSKPKNTTVPEGESNDSLQEIDQADLAAILPDVNPNSSTEQHLLSFDTSDASQPDQDRYRDVEDVLRAAMEDIQQDVQHQKESPQKGEKRDRSTDKGRSWSKGSREGSMSSPTKHSSEEKSANNGKQHRSGKRSKESKTASVTTTNTKSASSSSKSLKATTDRSDRTSRNPSHTKSVNAKWAQSSVNDSESNLPETGGKGHQKSERAKRRRGRPPRSNKDMEPQPQSQIQSHLPPQSQPQPQHQTQAQHPEPHYDPPEPLLRIDHASNVSPDSGIQSIAGSPTNNDSPSPSHIPTAMPVPTPHSHTHGDIPDLDLQPVSIIEPLDSRPPETAPTLSPQHGTDTMLNQSEKLLCTQGSQNSNPKETESTKTASASVKGVSSRTGVGAATESVTTDCSDSCDKSGSLVQSSVPSASKSNKKSRRGAGRTMVKPRLMPAPRVVSETISSRTTIELGPAYSDQAKNLPMPTLTRTDVSGRSNNNNNKSENLPSPSSSPAKLSIMAGSKPRRGRPPKHPRRQSIQQQSRDIVSIGKPSKPSQSVTKTYKIDRFPPLASVEGPRFPKQRILLERQPILSQFSALTTIANQELSLPENESKTEKTKTSLSTKDGANTSLSLGESVMPDVPVKKKRGRPRKRPLPDGTVASPGSDGSPGQEQKTSLRSSNLPGSWDGSMSRTFPASSERVQLRQSSLTSPGWKGLLSPSILSSGPTSRHRNKGRGDDVELDSILQSVHASIDSQFDDRDDGFSAVKDCTDEQKKKPETEDKEKGASKKASNNIKAVKEGECVTEDTKAKAKPSNQAAKKIVSKIRRPKLHVMMRRPKRRGKRKKIALVELSDLTAIGPSLHPKKVESKFIERPPKLQAPTLVVASGSKGPQDPLTSDSGIATDSSGADPDKVPPAAANSTTPTMPVLSPVRKDFFLPFPNATKPVLKAEDGGPRKRKKKLKHFKSKHKNIVDPVFIADIATMTSDLASLLISEDGPAVPNFMKEEVPLPTIFQLNRQILRRKRRKELQLTPTGKIKQLDSRKEMDLSMLTKEKARRGRKKKLISDSSLYPKDEDVAALNNEQCLPLKKRHKLISAAAAAQSEATQEIVKQVEPEFSKLTPPLLPKAPEKRKPGRPRKHPLPDQQHTSPRQGKCSSSIVLINLYLVWWSKNMCQK